VGVAARALGSHAFTTVRRLMSDLWKEERLGGAASGESGDDEWDGGDEDVEGGLEDGFDDPEGELEDEDWSESESEGEDE